MKRVRVGDRTVGGDPLAGLDANAVAGHELIGGDAREPAVADRPHERARELDEGRERVLRAVFLHHSECGVEREHHGDHGALDRPAAGVAQRGHDIEHDREEQHVDQRARELPQDAPQQRRRGRGRQPVRPERTKSLCGLFGAETAGRHPPEPLQSPRPAVAAATFDEHRIACVVFREHSRSAGHMSCCDLPA